MDTLKTMLMENNITFNESIFNTEDGIGEQPFVSDIANVFLILLTQIPTDQHTPCIPTYSRYTHILMVYPHTHGIPTYIHKHHEHD